MSNIKVATDHKSSEDRLRFGLVGLNFGLKILKEDILNGSGQKFMDFQAACSLNPAVVDEVSNRYGVRPFYRLDDMLADDELEVICLFTGPAGRARLIRKIIDAGKDVMTTKPFELDSQEALDLLEYAKKLGRVIHLNSPAPLTSPDLKQILAWQDEHNLGSIIGARCEAWASYREEEDGSWYDDPALCPVAPIYRLGIYLINDLIRLIGIPHSVNVTESRRFTRRPTSDNAQLGLSFPCGAIGNIFASFCIDDGQSWLNSMTLNFERGTIYRNVGPLVSTKPRLNPEMRLILRNGNELIRRETVVAGSSEDYQWDSFYEAVRSKSPINFIEPARIVAGIQVIEAMQRSLKSGRIECLQPVSSVVDTVL